MEPVKFTCQCHKASSRWLELAPTERHRYRVECDRCGKFIKWGAERECQDRQNARDQITVIRYEERIEPPRSSLDKFFTE